MRPRYIIIMNVGKNIMAPFFFPALNILKRDVGRNIYMTAVAASMTGNISSLFSVH
jgi:hypothetical protein